MGGYSKQLEASLAAMSVPYCSPKNQSNLAADDSVTIQKSRTRRACPTTSDEQY